MRKCIGILKISVIRKTIHRFLLKTYSLESLIEPAAWTTMGGGGEVVYHLKNLHPKTLREKKKIFIAVTKKKLVLKPNVTQTSSIQT